jgi:hypothetical protein
MSVSKDDAEDSLQPYLPQLRECIQYGFDAWIAFGLKAPELKACLCARTRASFIYDHIISRVRVVFSSARRVRIVDRRGFPELVIRNRYVIRFKKLDSKGRSRNILTRQQKLWFEQQLSLPEMPPAAEKLVAGYVLDMLGTEIERVLVTCPKDASQIEWMINLSDGDGASNIVPMPTSPRAPKSPNVRSTRPKKQSKDDPESA